MSQEIEKIRNIGISAHIDSGKTTLTERILYYTNKIHSMHEVRGKDGVGAVMDSMELEKERGITIQSAATNTTWDGHSVNIIDTPGHVDFTVEVERALKVLDGAIMILCAVGGVQSQSLTVDRQMKRYNVPRLAFINKCDRAGASPEKVTAQIRDQLKLNAVLIQLPIGLEDKFEGIIDLVEMKAIYYEGKDGGNVRIDEIPQEYLQQAKEMHDDMLDKVSVNNDELTEALLEENVTTDIIKRAIRKEVLDLSFVPVLVGSAYKNKGVQTMMDAVVDYLPGPSDIENIALDKDKDEAEVVLKSDPSLPIVANAFKLEDGRYGQLTYIRVYQGTIKKGVDITNTRTGKKIRVGRLVRMHSNEMEEINEAPAGDIVAIFGVDCASGDTFTDNGLDYSLTSMHIPKPVISISVKATDKKSEDIMSKAINRFCKEDPTLKSFVDHESGETILEGMGELHLDVYLSRMEREYGVTTEKGMPQVAYRETISRGSEFNYTHKKQSGGSGQFGRVAGILEPSDSGDYEFIDQIKGGVIPKEYIPSCDKGFRECLKKGTLIGFPITGVKVTINDGTTHSVDSSDMAFQLAAIGAFRETYPKCSPVILEPIMSVAIEGPEEFQGAIMASVNQRRGIIEGVTDNGAFLRINALVPLSEMFGYSTVLRSSTQGKAEFSMEFSKYERVPAAVSEKLKKEFAESNKDK